MYIAKHVQEAINFIKSRVHVFINVACDYYRFLDDTLSIIQYNTLCKPGTKTKVVIFFLISHFFFFHYRYLKKNDVNAKHFNCYCIVFLLLISLKI